MGRLSVAASREEEVASPPEETCLVMGVLSVWFPARPGLEQTLGTRTVPGAGRACGPPMCDDALPYCSRATSVLEAWARGRTTMESMLTWAGSSSVQTMQAATSSALSGSATPA